MNQLLAPILISFLLLTATPSKAKNFQSQELDSIVTTVRNNLISKGITAYKTGNYQKAVWFLKTYLNTRRVLPTPVEIEGFQSLALAYQKIGEPEQATKTIIWAINISHNSSIELANLEKTAGNIAYLQNQKLKASKHWEKARQLYLAPNIWQKWATTTLNLAKNSQELGYVQKTHKLLAELEKANIYFSDSAEAPKQNN